ncbi:GntR family transcriptional regulator [Oerskovia sp. M15]
MTDVLGQRITAGHLPAGSTLTLDGIGTEFGVSRTVTRETMRQLEALGLVRSGRRIGLVVLPEQDWNVYDARIIRWRLAGPGRDAQLRSLTELRCAVEPLPRPVPPGTRPTRLAPSSSSWPRACASSVRPGASRSSSASTPGCTP